MKYYKIDETMLKALIGDTLTLEILYKNGVRYKEVLEDFDYSPIDECYIDMDKTIDKRIECFEEIGV